MTGNALGGGLQIALGADIRIVAPDAKLSVLEIRWGLIPDMTGSQLLPELVGRDVAKELTFSGRIVRGEEAVTLGLATRADPDPRQAALDLNDPAQAAALRDLIAGADVFSQGYRLGTLARRSAVPVDLDVATNARYPEPIEVAAYYVASEALANAMKHAQASHVEISLAAHDGSLLLSVRDDGVGGADPARGSGLAGLADRVEALGGSIGVRSAAGAGTQITVDLPLE